MVQSDAQIALRALQEWWIEAGLDPAEVRAHLALSQAGAAAPKRLKVQPPTPLETAHALASAAQDLGALGRAVQGYGGCALRAAARNTVFLAGAENAPILVIGGHPDKADDDSGLPFSGPAGALLDAMLGAIGLSRSAQVMLGHLVFWRPPGDRSPTAGEIALCLPFLERAIALLAPKLIVLCGALAGQSLLRSDASLLQMRRRIHAYSATNGTSIDALVIHNPVYLLRRPQEKPLAWQDLQLMEARLEALAVARSVPL